MSTPLPKPAEPSDATDLLALPEDPAAAALIDPTIALYRALLPADVLADFSFILALVLARHPVGASLVARVTPGVDPARVTPPDPGGAAVARLLRAHRAASQTAGARVLAPDLSLAVLDAFLGTLRDDTGSAGLSDAAAHVFALLFCDTVVACLFRGLVDEAAARPAPGDVGGAPGAALRGALGRLARNDRGFLAGYQACGWDAERMQKRVKGDAELVQGRCAQAMMALAGALRKELAGAG